MKFEKQIKNGLRRCPFTQGVFFFVKLRVGKKRPVLSSSSTYEVLADIVGSAKEWTNPLPPACLPPLLRVALLLPVLALSFSYWCWSRAMLVGLACRLLTWKDASRVHSFPDPGLACWKTHREQTSGCRSVAGRLVGTDRRLQISYPLRAKPFQLNFIRRIRCTWLTFFLCCKIHQLQSAECELIPSWVKYVTVLNKNVSRRLGQSFSISSS